MNAAETETIPAHPTRPRSNRFRRLCAGLLGILVIGVSITVLVRSAQKPEMPEGVSLAEYEKASEDFHRLYHRRPTDADVLMILGETAVQNDRLDAAIHCFAGISSDHHRYGLSARFQEAQVLLRMDEADQAENSFRIFLQLAQNRRPKKPDDILLARKWLVFLLAVELRFVERKGILQQMLQDGQFDVYDAKQLFFPSLLIWQSNLGSSRLQKFLQKDPDNRRLLIARARYFTAEGDLEAAEAILKKLRQQDAADPNVVAASLECCFERNDWEAFATHMDRAAEFSESEPWHLTVLRGQWALHNRDWAGAERWFRHTLTHDPANPVCHMGLARVFQELSRNEERQAMQQRSLTLARIRVNLSAVDNHSAEAARTLAADARELQMDEAADAFEFLSQRMIRR